MAKNVCYKNSKGEKVKRCTQIIDILGYNKNALVAWAKKYGQKAQGISDAALEIGTLTHKMIEGFVKHEEVDTSDYSFDALVLAQNGLDSFKRWCDVVQPEFLVNEYTIISESGNWGGTTDTIMRIKTDKLPDNLKYGWPEDSVNVLADYKTAKAIYIDHIIQIAAYREGVHEMNGYDDATKETLESINGTKIIYMPIDLCMAIHIKKDLSKDDSNDVGIHWLPNTTLDTGFEAFEMALRLCEIQGELKLAA
jgi:hypothetical protein